MATILLGLSGSELTLPPVRFRGGDPSPADMPTTYDKNVDRQVQLDGTVRTNYLPNFLRVWPLVFDWLTAAELATLQTLAAYTQKLHYQNNNESATWYWVDMTDFSSTLIASTLRLAAVRYSATMTLKEVK